VKRRLLLAPIGVLVACRFGGPSANPDDYVAGDAGADAAQEAGQGSPGDDAGVSPPHADASVPPGDDAPPGDATPPAEASDASNTSDASAADALVEGGACATPVAVCNPVHDTGCNPLQQCDVDTTQTATPTGLCVFNATSEGGGACTMTFVSESCLPGQTCVSGTCRSLCFCNADCQVGQCCSDPSGPQGFTLCAACP
jgi:hypothetical protein